MIESRGKRGGKKTMLSSPFEHQIAGGKGRGKRMKKGGRRRR
jgi:hypothetical protein